MTLGGLPRIAMGCMRLSTAADRDDDRSVSAILAALDAGVRLLDTADAYARDATDIGHNERLIARALASWSGDRRQVVVATKGGMTRPAGQWMPDGRAKHLTAACAASRTALGVERIRLYQLHAPDPRTPLATSVRALENLRRNGLIEAIGLCNVSVAQIEEARAIAPIASVQVEFGIWCDKPILGGVVEYCLAQGIMLLAHRPLGGERRRARTERDRVLRDVAARHGATPAEIALAMVADLSPLIVPLPGATRPETARSIARAAGIALDDADRERLGERMPSWRHARAPRSVPAANEATGEVVLIMGLPAAGKSTLARRFVEEGYLRLNRDATGGTLERLAAALEQALASGAARIVLDNTYLSRTSRAPVVAAAQRHGRPVRCVHVSTTLEDAQINAVSRLLTRHGRLLAGDELREAARQDAAAFAPGVQFRLRRELEPPTPAEGFSRIDTEAFERTYPADHVGRGLLVWCDDVLVRSRAGARTPTSPDDVQVIEGRGAVLRGYREQGWHLVGMSWQPEVAAGERTPADVEAVFARMQAVLGVEMDVLYCPHAAGPPGCWCRKPLPGLGVLAIARHRLDPGRCLFVGRGPQDPGFARRLGLEYCDAEQFFMPAREA